MYNTLPKRIILYLVIAVFAAAALLPSALLFSFRVNARLAIKEARSIHSALYLLAIEYYGSDTTVYDPTQANGLSSEALKELRSLAGVSESDVYLLEWDSAQNRPAKILYLCGDYVCTYGFSDSDSTNARRVWTVSRRMPFKQA